MIWESLVAAIRKRRAATPQTLNLSAVDIGHERGASVGTVAFRVCGIVVPKSKMLIVIFKFGGPRSWKLFSSISMICSLGSPPTGFLPLLVLYLLCPCSAASQGASCDVSTYGKPEKSDCLTLFEKFTSPQNLQTRFFDEEQLRVDSNSTWPGVANVFGQPIVQLPKYFAMSMSIRVLRYFVTLAPGS